MAYEIRYGLGGSFGGAGEWESVDVASMEEAEQAAYEAACEEYEMYDGLHGLRNVSMIMEEDGFDYEEATEQWCEERGSWLDYEAREV